MATIAGVTTEKYSKPRIRKTLWETLTTTNRPGSLLVGIFKSVSIRISGTLGGGTVDIKDADGVVLVNKTAVGQSTLTGPIDGINPALLAGDGTSDVDVVIITESY